MFDFTFVFEVERNADLTTILTTKNRLGLLRLKLLLYSGGFPNK